MDAARVRELADGRAYTGRQALKLGLVDAIGGEQDATALAGGPEGRVGRSAGARMSRTDGSPSRASVRRASGGCSTALWKSLFSQGVMLDGAWAVWQRFEQAEPLLRLPGRMTKSELIAELAASNPHLRGADVELIVATIFDEITAALSRGERVELRGFGAFTVKRRECPHRAQSAHRRGGAGGREGGAVLQGRQGTARAGQSRQAGREPPG